MVPSVNCLNAQLFRLPHPAEIEIQHGKHRGHESGEHGVGLQPLAQQGPDFPALALAFRVAYQRGESEREAEAREHEDHGHIVDERCGREVANPVMTYHEGVRERDEHHSYLSYHYRAGESAEPSGYAPVSYLRHKACKDTNYP